MNRQTIVASGGFPDERLLEDVLDTRAAGARYEGAELAEVVVSQTGAGAYRIGPGGEEPLAVTRLS